MENDQNAEPFDYQFLGLRRKPFRRFRWFFIIALLALVIIGLPLLAGFYTDWLWFKEVGYESVFTTLLLTKLTLGILAALVVAVLLWLNFKLALRLSAAQSRLVRHIIINNQRLEMPDFARAAQAWILPVAIVIGLLAGMRVGEFWEVILKFRHRTAFGEADPIFGRDIGFYFFTLPLLENLSEMIFLILIAALVGTLVLYVLRGGIELKAARIEVDRAARPHLFALLTVFFLLLGFRAWLETFNLLFSSSSQFTGAGYTDLNARLPLLRVEIIASLLMAALAILNIFLFKFRLLAGGIGLYLLVLAAGWLYPSFLQRFSVAPNELAKETPYIIHNIAATRKAYSLDHVEEREIMGDAQLSRQDIDNNKSTINNIRLWDHEPLLNTFGQLQEFRNYYQFESVDNDRYQINNEIRQIMISARELNLDSPQLRNWINERLTYTHGYGLTLGPVNQITPEGLPVLFIKDLPPVSSVPSLNITRPEIYYGELSQDPVYVKTTSKEFNYPSGEQNVYTSYAGDGGVPISSYIRKMLFAARFNDMKLLLSNDVSAESRVLFHRSIRERLNRIAPFLRFDQDPYLVISEGRLFWIADAYTLSDRYPYSQPVPLDNTTRVNYMRNSVKAVVDAYHGKVQLYIADQKDPLIATWGKIFPGVLRPLSEMSADLRSHLRYPEDIFQVQTAVYSIYHMDEPQIFYNKEDQWVPASASDAEGKTESMKPYYTIMKLPGETREEFILMLPFTPRNKENLASWMAARADGDNYGRLLIYRFPKQKLIYGPRQVMLRIKQDTEISQQLSLWNRSGLTAKPGTLQVIPVNESLVYVQPLFLKAEGGKIPELKRVVVVAENRIAMEETLEQSLARVFGGQTPPSKPVETLAGAAPPVAPAALSVKAAAAEAKQIYDRAVQAQREGDWARYGEEIKRLGAALEQLSKQQ
jgi:uncharacterized membrane protein (UPF0182 family)